MLLGAITLPNVCLPKFPLRKEHQIPLDSLQKRQLFEWIVSGPACQHHWQKVCVADAEIVSV